MPTTEYSASCTTCQAPVEFRRDDYAPPFWMLVPTVPGSGSDHLATWCAECGPRHRKQNTLFRVGIVDPATGRTRQTVSGFDPARVLAAAVRTQENYPGSITVNQSH